MNSIVPVWCRAPLRPLPTTFARSKSISSPLKPPVSFELVKIILFSEMSRCKMFLFRNKERYALIASRIEVSSSSIADRTKFACAPQLPFGHLLNYSWNSCWTWYIPADTWHNNQPRPLYPWCQKRWRRQPFSYTEAPECVWMPKWMPRGLERDFRWEPETKDGEIPQDWMACKSEGRIMR